MSTDRQRLIAWLDRKDPRMHDAREASRVWITRTPADGTLAGMWRACGDGTWLLWAADRAGVRQSTLKVIAWASVLRALREHVPAVLGEAGLHAAAKRLRGLSGVESREAVFATEDALAVVYDAASYALHVTAHALDGFYSRSSRRAPGVLLAAARAASDAMLALGAPSGWLAAHAAALTSLSLGVRHIELTRIADEVRATPGIFDAIRDAIELQEVKQ